MNFFNFPSKQLPDDGGISGMRILEQSQPGMAPVVGEKQISEAQEAFRRYKAGKETLESRIVEDEMWWQLQHWEVIRQRQPVRPDGEVRPEPTSAWLFNTLSNKHADAMDNYPTQAVLPRELGDDQDAKALSSILPVIFERNEFEETYSDAWWEKLKHGTAVFFIPWDKNVDNGLGDIGIHTIDMLNIFWEPGITDIQKSRKLFIVDLVDTDLLEAEYPQFAGKLGSAPSMIKQYVKLDENAVDLTKKSMVVDCYYKTRSASGAPLLHFMKYCEKSLLYASENDQDLVERGIYDHGQFPVVFDVLFPEKGSPCGFGYIAITKDPQLYIDKLGQNILEHSMMASKARFFARKGCGINVKQFKNWSEPIVDVEGDIDEERLRQIVINPIDSIYVNIMQMKIDEMKETSSNRDFSSGGTASGVTAAAAIAALQEAGNKVSRDMIGAAYRAYTKINYLAIELIRQFYDETRSFRITGQVPGSYSFIDYSNARIKDQEIGVDMMGNAMFRRPVFDIKIKAQKRNPFSQMAQNELAKELYGLGFFNPERAQECLVALELMDFEGKDKVSEQVHQGQTLMNVLQQVGMERDKFAFIVQQLTGQDMGITDGQGAANGQQVKSTSSAGNSGLASQATQAQQANMTGYMQQLAGRSKPNMDAMSGKAAPR